MRSQILLFSILVLAFVALSACAPAPTSAPSGGTAAPTTASVPASGGTVAPLPAQPTVPPVAPRQPTAFASATSAPIINVPGPTRAATTAPTGAATTAGGSPTTAATNPPVSGPTAPGVATGQRVELKLEFTKNLVSAEEVDEIAPILKAVPGIFSVSGNEVAITILYDPGLILPNQIRAKLASMGHAVKE